MSRATNRWLEVLSIVLIGDGIISVLRPVGHSRMWWAPLPGVRPLMEWCEARPNATQAIGAAQVLAGLWLDAALYREGGRVPRP